MRSRIFGFLALAISTGAMVIAQSGAPQQPPQLMGDRRQSVGVNRQIALGAERGHLGVVGQQRICPAPLGGSDKVVSDGVLERCG